MTDYAPPTPLAHTALGGSLLHSHIFYAQKPSGVTFLEVRGGEISLWDHSRRTEHDTWGESNPVGVRRVSLKHGLPRPPCHLRETWMGEWGTAETVHEVSQADWSEGGDTGLKGNPFQIKLNYKQMCEQGNLNEQKKTTKQRNPNKKTEWNHQRKCQEDNYWRI